MRVSAHGATSAEQLVHVLEGMKSSVAQPTGSSVVALVRAEQRALRCSTVRGCSQVGPTARCRLSIASTGVAQSAFF